MDLQKEIENMLATMTAFFTLDINSMGLSDKIYYLKVISDFSESVKPLVMKYGDSPEQIQENYNKKIEENRMKDLIANMVLQKMISDSDKNN